MPGRPLPFTHSLARRRCDRRLASQLGIFFAVAVVIAHSAAAGFGAKNTIKAGTEAGLLLCVPETYETWIAQVGIGPLQPRSRSRGRSTIGCRRVWSGIAVLLMRTIGALHVSVLTGDGAGGWSGLQEAGSVAGIGTLVKLRLEDTALCLAGPPIRNSSARVRNQHSPRPPWCHLASRLLSRHHHSPGATGWRCLAGLDHKVQLLEVQLLERLAVPGGLRAANPRAAPAAALAEPHHSPAGVRCGGGLVAV